MTNLRRLSASKTKAGARSPNLSIAAAAIDTTISMVSNATSVTERTVSTRVSTPIYPPGAPLLARHRVARAYIVVVGVSTVAAVRPDRGVVEHDAEDARSADGF